MRASGDSPRNFELWSRRTPELELPSRNYHTNGRTFKLSTDLMCIVPLHEGYPVCPCGGQNHGNLQSLFTVPVYPFGTWGGRPGAQRAQKVLNKLDFTTFCGYKFRSSSAKVPREAGDLLHPGPQMNLNRHCLFKKNARLSRLEQQYEDMKGLINKL
ncbi:hypothetical protein TNCV_5111281 [Trichonephila clavipes]|nr:hypothetical protein TNCV_5111281 [Trichonephila clavipes]